MKFNKKIIIIIIIVLTISCCLLYFLKTDDNMNNNSSISLEQAEKDVVEFTKGLVEEGITEKEIAKKVGKNIGSVNIMIGKDSYLREKTTSKGIDVSIWEKAQEKYVSNVEKKIKDSFSYNIDETIMSDDDAKIVRVSIKSYYYFTYLNDLNLLARELLNLSGYKPEVDFAGNETNKTKADLYKAKIKSMEILDDYLNNYDNYYEYKTTEVITYPDKEATNISYEQYLLDIIGYGYNISFGSDKYINDQQQRLNKYLTEAAENGTLDKKDPLKLK